eukprot:SAG31_NODE_3552_length_4131_cov_2.172123_4_plen_64_part_00
MNQKSTTNVIEELSGVSLVEVARAQQLIYWQNRSGSVLGLWFYDPEEVRESIMTPPTQQLPKP